MFSFNKDNVGLLHSHLYNEQSFFPAFIADAKRATESIIVESPFISYRRLSWLYSTLEESVKQGVSIVINTRDPMEHEGAMRQQASDGIGALQNLGILVLYTGNHHRKVAIIDRNIL